METVHTQLASCLLFVKESLRTGSQGEVVKMKKVAMKQIKEMADNFKPDMLPPCELANVKFLASPELTQVCQEFGTVFLEHTSPKKCYAIGKGLEVTELDEGGVAILHIVDDKGEAYTTPVKTLTSDLVSQISGEKIDCCLKRIEPSQCTTSYQATSREKCQLHIKVEGKHIKGSPFPVSVMLPVQPVPNFGSLEDFYAF